MLPMPKKEVQKEVQNRNLNLMVYNFLSEGLTPVQITNRLQISMPLLSYHLKQLKDDNLVQKIGYGTWQTNKDIIPTEARHIIQTRNKLKSLSMGLRGDKKPTTNLHAFQINFPILQGEVKDSDWDVKNQLNHWLPKYKKLNILGGLTIRNNNNKSITIFAKARNIEQLDEVDQLGLKIRAYITDFFKQRGVILDFLESRVKCLNLATEDRQASSKLRKGEKFELDLGKQAEKVLPKDNIAAKAWLDGSPFSFSAETNDKEWKREYLNMPFSIQALRQWAEGMYEERALLKSYQEQIKLHLEVERRQLVNLNIQNKLLDKLQTKLGGEKMIKFKETIKNHTLGEFEPKENKEDTKDGDE